MTVLLLRPDGSTGTGTVTGGSSIHDALSDTSDSSYVTLGTGDLFQVAVGTASLPAGSIVRGSFARLRVQNSTTPPPIVYTSLSAVLLSGSTLASSTMPVAPSISEITTATSTVALTQTQVNDLSVRVSLPSGQPSTRVYEIWVHVVAATKPTVSVSAPSGVVSSTSQPLAQWTHTAGSDGGPQTSWEAKVYSAAQYSAAGFSPATSSPTWSSGIKSGSTSSTTIGSLPNGGSWRCYVRTAQTINGVTHWGDWAFSSFSTSYPAPQVASVTAVSQPDYSRVRLVVTRVAGSPNWTSVDVERSGDGGVSWLPVRGGYDALPTGDQWIGYDHEAPGDTPVLYRGRGRDGQVVGEWQTSATSVTVPAVAVWAKAVSRPSLNRVVCPVSVPEQSWQRQTGVHYVIDGETPIVVSDARQLQRVTFEVETSTLQQSYDLRALLNEPIILMQWPASYGLEDMYLAHLSDQVIQIADQYATEYRRHRIELQRVARPETVGIAATVAGSSYDDLIAQYPTFDALSASGKTFGDFV